MRGLIVGRMSRSTRTVAASRTGHHRSVVRAGEVADGGSDPADLQRRALLREPGPVEVDLQLFHAGQRDRAVPVEPDGQEQRTVLEAGRFHEVTGEHGARSIRDF